MSKISIQRFGRKKIFDGYSFQVVVDDVKWPNKNRLRRDLIVHGGISVIIPELDKNHLVLIRQYRYGANQYLWEIPAGTIHKKESPLLCAKREIQEEIGYKARSWKTLASFFASPGFSTEIIHAFLAKGLIRTQVALEEDEILEAHVFTLSEVREMILKRQIRDAKSLVPLFYYLLQRKIL